MSNTTKYGTLKSPLLGNPAIMAMCQENEARIHMRKLAKDLRVAKGKRNRAIVALIKARKQHKRSRDIQSDVVNAVCLVQCRTQQLRLA